MKPIIDLVATGANIKLLRRECGLQWRRYSRSYRLSLRDQYTSGKAATHCRQLKTSSG